ncbi:MAG: hypothetical protein M3O86_06035 [Actinomycetota bacterium]|nr:hypothetical protein [Actinomycetota bacterium]
MPDPKTKELQIEQIAREREERRRAEKAGLEEETEQHARRAERASYLKDKLNERAAAEDEAEQAD